MSKAVTTLSLWDDRRKPVDISNSEADLKVSTMAEGQYRFTPAGGDSIVINESQARWLAQFLTASRQEEPS